MSIKVECVGFLVGELERSSSNAPLKGTVRVPNSRKLIDGSWGSAFIDFHIWDNSQPSALIGRLNNQGKNLQPGAHLQLTLKYREEQYEKDNQKRLSRGYEVIDMDFVASSRPAATADDAEDEEATETPHGYSADATSQDVVI